MYSVLNTRSEYTYFYISKNITSTLSCLFVKSSKACSVSLGRSPGSGSYKTKELSEAAKRTIRTIGLKELSEAIGKSTKYVKMTSSAGSFH